MPYTDVVTLEQLLIRLRDEMCQRADEDEHCYGCSFYVNETCVIDVTLWWISHSLDIVTGRYRT